MSRPGSGRRGSGRLGSTGVSLRPNTTDQLREEPTLLIRSCEPLPRLTAQFSPSSRLCTCACRSVSQPRMLDRPALGPYCSASFSAAPSSCTATDSDERPSSGGLMLSVMLSNGNVVGFGRPALLSAFPWGDSLQEGDDAFFLEGHQAADWGQLVQRWVGQLSKALHSLPSISVLAARSLRKLGAAEHVGERARGDVWNGDETLESGSMAEDSTMLLSVRSWAWASGCLRV